MTKAHYCTGACQPRAGLIFTVASTMPDATLHTSGPIIERLGPVLYRTALPNGKIILAHLSKRLVVAGTVFEPGQRVVMELTAYDFEQARLLDRVE